VRTGFVVVGVVVMLLSACGGGGRLSAAAYQAQVQASANPVIPAAVGFRHTGKRQLIEAVTRFEVALQRQSDEIAALKVPPKVENANAELAKSLHDWASQVRALIPKIKKETLKAAYGDLPTTFPLNVLREQHRAFEKLAKLGYPASKAGPQARLL
jgi:hypothetical protein